MLARGGFTKFPVKKKVQMSHCKCSNLFVSALSENKRKKPCGQKLGRLSATMLVLHHLFYHRKNSMKPIIMAVRVRIMFVGRGETAVKSIIDRFVRTLICRVLLCELCGTKKN